MAYSVFVNLLGRAGQIGHLYTDNSPELIKCAYMLGVAHSRSTPEQPQANGVAERLVRHLVEGARTLLEHPGLPACMWPHAGCQFVCAHNVTAVVVVGGR